MARFRVRDVAKLRDRMAKSKREVPHSVRSLAQQVNVSHALVGHLLTGERDSLDGDVAERIAEALDTPVGDLFVEEGSPSGYGDNGSNGAES